MQCKYCTKVVRNDHMKEHIGVHLNEWTRNIIADPYCWICRKPAGANFYRHMRMHYSFPLNASRKLGIWVDIELMEQCLPAVIEYDWKEGHVNVKDESRQLMYARKSWIG